MEGLVFTYAKAYIEGMFHICDQLCDWISKKTEDEDVNRKFKELLKVDLIKIISYFTLADKNISGNDARCMSDLFAAPITPNVIKEIVLSENLYSESFENEVPASLRLFLDIDNMLYKSNGAPEGDTLWKKYMTTLVACAYALEEVNGRDYQHISEEIDGYIRFYCDKLINYCNRNDDSVYADITVDFEKNMEVSSDEADNQESEEDNNKITEEEYQDLVLKLEEIDTRIDELCGEIKRYKDMFKAASSYMTDEEKMAASKRRVIKNKELIQFLSIENERRYNIVKCISESGRECKRRNRILYPTRPMNSADLSEEDSIEELELGVRTWNCMRRSGFSTIKDLCVPEVVESYWIRKMGRYHLQLLINTLDLYGFTFAGTEHEEIKDYFAS